MTMPAGPTRGVTNNLMSDHKTTIKWVIFLTGVVILIYLCWLILAPFISVLAWAIVLAITFFPIHKRLVEKTKSPTLSAAISSFLVIITILIPILLVTTLVVKEFIGFKDSLQVRVQEALDPNSTSRVRDAVEWAKQYIDIDQSKIVEYLKTHGGEIGSKVASYSFNFLGSLTNFIVSIIFAIFTMFFLFRDGDKAVDKLPDLLPLQRSQCEQLIARVRDVIGASIYGVLVIAIIQGTLGGLMFWILGIPSPLMWGVVMIVMSLIPMAGAGIVWVPAAIYLIATGHWVKAVILAVWGGVIIGSIDNFLRPKLVGDRVGLSELVLFFAVLGGLQVFGVLGIVLGPVVVAIIASLFVVFMQEEEIEHLEGVESEAQADSPGV